VNMQVALVAQFLPRMELDHLESWIRYYLRLGVTTIRLYNNGLTATDGRFSGEPLAVWEKKPFACFHLELSDADVIKRVDSIIARYPQVEQFRWEYPLRGKGEDRNVGQLRAVRESHEWAAAHSYDWLLHVDIDELVVPCGRDLTAYLMDVPADVYRIVMWQKVMTCRWIDGASVPYRELTQSYGILRKKPKCLHRPRLATDINVHDGSTPVRDGLRIFNPDPAQLRFHHFRGTASGANTPVNMLTYAHMTGVPTHYEAAHLRFLS
jgi:hypothetical protein